MLFLQNEWSTGNVDLRESMFRLNTLGGHAHSLSSKKLALLMTKGKVMVPRRTGALCNFPDLLDVHKGQPELQMFDNELSENEGHHIC